MPCGYYPYPPALATYEDVVSSRDLFMDTLKKLHSSMGTKFMIPVVGGRDLDLHRLFIEVTSRGGIAKVVGERRWKEVTSAFEFPSSATNASFILRKYYVSLLYNYEQIYFFKSKSWTPSSPASVSPAIKQFPPNTSLSSSSSTLPVSGVIDGKFEDGYLVTVQIGSEEFKGVLYEAEADSDALSLGGRRRIEAATAAAGGLGLGLVHDSSYSSSSRSRTRRKRRKKSEIRKRDPGHPKPNRSGYNFFFADQHAKLKPLYHGKDREISRIIGESWNKLNEDQRLVYQEKALKDKERYKMEMEEYRERLRRGQIVPIPAVAAPPPVQQQQPQPEPPPPAAAAAIGLSLVAEAAYTEGEGEEASTTDKSNLEEYQDVDDDDDDDDSEEMNLKNVNVEMMADDASFHLQTQTPPEKEKEEIEDSPQPQPQPRSETQTENRIWFLSPHKHKHNDDNNNTTNNPTDHVVQGETISSSSSPLLHIQVQQTFPFNKEL
ncbi:high mobility group B protein 15-like [Andrographis paniculata]|uniref:high mobility group B protein 15-like n=1 Tax=Andrographis paniculata TaxID=175694 RepID=UPI0021E7DA1C|nr:high mobility group B protein 15-like [Andrographis paniculata]